MITRTVQNISMPALGFGTWKLTGQGCIDSQRLALDVGYRHIDTAQIYENEKEVGTALRQSGIDRSGIFLTTKIWMSQVADGAMQSSFEESLRKLETDYVDLLLIHWPVASVKLGEQMKALESIRSAGKARLIGVSNFTVPLMREACETLGAAIAVNQIEYHPFLAQTKVLDYARAHDMVATAYSPLARGKVADGSPGSATLRVLAQKYDKNPGQIALRWLLQQPNVAAIPKAAGRANITANFDIFDFELSGNEMAQIFALAHPDGRLVNPEWAPAWDT